MVGLPNRTGRCTICKRMKCDLSRPVCSRCRRIGLRCEYLIPQQGQVFINRSVTTPFVKAVHILASAHKTKQLENSVPKQVTSSRARHDESLRHSVPKSPDPDPVQPRRDGGANERLALPVNRCVRGLSSHAILPSRCRTINELQNSSIPGTSATHFASLPPQNRMLRTHAALSHTVGLTTLDPFDTQRQSKLPSADQLLHHYLSTVIGKCLPAGYRPETNPFVLGWWPLVQSDDLLFHTMLLASVYDLEWQSGKPNICLSETYMRECIHLLKERVQDPVYGARNQTIGAVATLASLEYGRNMTAVKTHIEGLKKMVAIRGGMGKIRSSSPVTATVVFWFSLLFTFGPQFLPEEPIDLHDPPQWLLEISESAQAVGLVDFDTYGICKSVSDILLEIRYLSHFFSTQSHDIASPILEDLDIPSKAYSILQRLLQTKPHADPGSHAACITECCRFAAMIFLLLAFENQYLDPTLLVNFLVHKLQTSLGSIIPCSLNGSNKLLAWLLSVGGVAALNLPNERDWFVSHLAESAAELNLKSWDEMKSCLEVVIWIDAIDDYPFSRLWEEVLSMSLV